MNTSLSTIMARRSVRRYQASIPSLETLEALSYAASNPKPGPFGSIPRFTLIDTTTLPKEVMASFGTYGIIKGARWYLIGSLVAKPGASEDFGWVMEDLILQATNLGLGTCWLGGTFKREVFASLLHLQPNEYLAAASPLGLGTESIGFGEGMIRALVGANNRKPLGTLVFKDNPSQAMDYDDLGPWKDCIEAVRRAPSASNKQPWRIIRDTAKGSWHFYLNEDKPYNGAFAPVYLQNMDMGIALRHFSLVAEEQKLPGGLTMDKDLGPVGTWTYIMSWQE